MRKKPSMFSKDYRRQLKLRRIKYMVIFLIIIMVIGIAGLVLTNKEGIVAIKKIFVKESIENNNHKSEENENKTEENSEGESVVEEKPTQTSSNIELKSGKKVIINYEEKDGVKKINTIDSDSQVKCSLSPSQEIILILDNEAQDMYILNRKEELTNITNEQYVSTTNEVFRKENVLSYNPSYKWVESAQFIDNTHIAYSSSLPWINDNDNRYLWIYNMENNTHKGYYNIKGKSFEVGQITDKGLTISLDNKEIIVDKDGKIVQ
ncbi:hypothetical protein [Clostridium sp.]|uniref:hypothetical protein n=1 Tax=Clostridium sp. TaxID=1506 RepID=UPI0032163244